MSRRRETYQNPWRLPEDGIVDEIAVEIAARGERRVALTDTERRAAAALIVARGGHSGDIARRLFIDSSTATRLLHLVRSETDQTAAPEAA